MGIKNAFRLAALIGLAVAALAGCTTPTALPTATVRPTPGATSTPLPSPSSTPIPKVTSVDLGVPAGDIYNVLGGALDAGRGLVYAVANEGDLRMDAGVVAVVDLEKHSVLASAPLPVVLDWISVAALSSDGARLYVAGRAPDERQIAIAVATGVGPRPLGEVLGTVSNVRNLALDAEEGQLYVANEEHLRRLDALSLEEHAAVDLPEALGPNILLAVNPRSQRVYLCASGGNAIYVYRMDNLAFVGMLDPGAQVYGLAASPTGPEVYATVQAFTRHQSVGRVAVIRDDRIAAQWDIGEPYYTGRIVVDDNGRVYLLQDGVQDGVSQSRIQILDPATGTTIHTIMLPPANLVYSTPFVINGKLVRLSDVLFTVDIRSGEIGEPLHLGVSVVQMALDGESGILYALDSAGVVHVVNTATMIPVHAWPLLDTGLGRLYEGQMTLHGGRLYAADFRTDRTLVLDANTGDKMAAIPKAGQVSVDEARKRLFVANQGIFIADMDTHQLIGSVEGTVRQDRQLYSPGAVGSVYDPTRDRLLVTMTNNAAGSGARTWLDVYDAKTLARLETPIQSDQRFVDGVAVDGREGRIWIASNYPRATLSVWAPDGRLLARTLGVAGPLFLDSGRGRLYVRGWGGLVAVDTDSRDVVGFRPLAVRFPDVAVFDEREGRFYVVSSNSATVQVVDPEPLPVAADSPAGLPPRPVRELAVGGDGTMLAVVSVPGGASLYRSEEGGWVPVRGWFAQDALLRVMAAPGTPATFFAFPGEGAYSPGGLFCSTDGGRTWHVSARGITDFYIRDLAISPDFAADGSAVLVAGESGIFQTADGGQTWRRTSDMVAIRAAASEGPTFVVLSHGEQYSRTLVYRMRGRDGTLERVGEIPVVAYSIRTLALSPRFAQDGVALAAAESGGILLSRDGGKTWESVGPSLAYLVAAFAFLFSPDFPTDRTVYASVSEMFYGGRQEQRLLRSTDGGLRWEQGWGEPDGILCIALGPDGRIWAGTTNGRVEPLTMTRMLWSEAPAPTPTFTPPPPPTPVPTPTPLVFLSPPADIYWPDAIFLALWKSEDTLRQALGWAADPSAHETEAALEAFEGGLMIWRQDVGEVYILFPESDWYAITDTWTPDQPESAPSFVPPAGRFQPIRGFGKVWRENQWFRERLGWAVEPERGATAQAQRFEHGWLLHAESSIYALVNADIGPAFWHRRDASP